MLQRLFVGLVLRSVFKHSDARSATTSAFIEAPPFSQSFAPPRSCREKGVVELVVDLAELIDAL